MASPLGLYKQLQSAATTGNGSALDAIGLGTLFTVYIVGTGTISAGAVQVEVAHDPAYAGTWAAIGSPVTVVSGAALIVPITGPHMAVRARISTNIAGGGSVSVFVIAS